MEILLYFKLAGEDEWIVEMLKYFVEERLEHHLDSEQKEWFEFLCTDKLNIFVYT